MNLTGKYVSSWFYSKNTGKNFDNIDFNGDFLPVFTFKFAGKL